MAKWKMSDREVFFLSQTLERAEEEFHSTLMGYCSIADRPGRSSCCPGSQHRTELSAQDIVSVLLPEPLPGPFPWLHQQWYHRGRDWQQILRYQKWFNKYTDCLAHLRTAGKSPFCKATHTDFYHFTIQTEEGAAVCPLLITLCGDVALASRGTWRENTPRNKKKTFLLQLILYDKAHH